MRGYEIGLKIYNRMKNNEVNLIISLTCCSERWAIMKLDCANVLETRIDKSMRGVCLCHTH